MKKLKIILITILFLCTILSIVIIKQNANIQKKRKVVKQMNETEQVSNLDTQINNLNASHIEYANEIQTAKRSLATAITNQGISTSEEDTFETMATNIGNILDTNFDIDSFNVIGSVYYGADGIECSKSGTLFAIVNAVGNFTNPPIALKVNSTSISNTEGYKLKSYSNDTVYSAHVYLMECKVNQGDIISYTNTTYPGGSTDILFSYIIL